MHQTAMRRALWLALAAIAAVVAHVLVGASDPEHLLRLRYSPVEVAHALWDGPGADTAAGTILWQFRAPRAIACLLVGAILGIVGSAFQALFRNPLAEPYVVGASSGAAIGGAFAQVFGFAMFLNGLAMTAAAFATAMGSLGLVLAISRVRGAIDPQRLLVAGVVTSAMLSSLVACLLLAAGQDSNQVLRWLLGSVTPMYWPWIPALAVAAILGGGYLVFQTRRLNAFAIGEDAAKQLGVDTARLKPMILVVGTAMTAIAVGTVGVIGFLGMIAPHMARRIVGVDWRYSLPASGFVGACVLTLADIGAQWIVPGAELPVGVVTALLSAPALLGLMRQTAIEA